MNRALAVFLAAPALLLASTCASAQNRSDPAFLNLNGQVVAPSGGTCATPAGVATTTPYNDAGDTCGNANSITNYSGAVCAANLAFPYPGEDVVYELTVGAGANFAISADLAGSTGDLALFLLTTCGDGASCIDSSQDAIGVGAGPEVIEAAAYPAGTYYLYIDSYYAVGDAASCGTYDLSITGTLPVELNSFSVD